MSYFDLLARMENFRRQACHFEVFCVFMLLRLSAYCFSVEASFNLELKHLKRNMDVKYEVSSRNARVSHR